MSLFIVVHALKIDSEQFSEAMAGPDILEFAKAMSSGQTPAKCVKSWDPIPYGNTDTFICLWEADNPEDISTTLGDDMLAMITCDPMEVNEIDWAEVAASG